MIHDPMDNITNKNTEHGAYQYGYDDLYRLTNVDNPEVPSLEDEAYTYDPVGNRLTSADVAGDWDYNQNNELQAYGDVSFVYNANGNMTQKTDGGVVTNYVYNPENRLTRVEDGNNSTVISEYYYDPFGRRLWKDVGGTRTIFHYNYEGLIGEYDSSGLEIKTYGFRPGSTWTTDPLFMKEVGNYYFYNNDHLGTPHNMIAVNGAIVWSAKYDSFGKAKIEIETVENNLRFPGQYFDEETGFHYNYHRYYDSSTGRYLTPDQIGLLGGINLYIYAQNNPIKMIDPFGLDATDDRILNRTVLNAFQKALNDSQIDTTNAHEEGGLFKGNTIEPAPRGNSDTIDLPFLMNSGDIPDGKFHTHPHREGTPVPGKPDVEYKPEKASPSDRDKAFAYPFVRHYIITPDGKILKYTEDGVVADDLGTISSRLQELNKKDCLEIQE